MTCMNASLRVLSADNEPSESPQNYTVAFVIFFATYPFTLLRWSSLRKNCYLTAICLSKLSVLLEYSLSVPGLSVFSKTTL